MQTCELKTSYSPLQTENVAPGNLESIQLQCEVLHVDKKKVCTLMLTHLAFQNCRCQSNRVSI